MEIMRLPLAFADLVDSWGSFLMNGINFFASTCGTVPLDTSRLRKMINYVRILTYEMT